ncbi:MAG: rod shape-determining protein MreD [Bacteroidota bacterium]
MNSTLIQIFRFVILVLLQALVLNNVLFLGFINPYLYPLFIILLPLNLNQIQALFYAFLLGLSVDFFDDTGGVHAGASVLIAYVRPIILRFSFGINYDYQTLKFYNEGFKQKFIYIFLMVFVHHLAMFALEYFSLQHIKEILINTVFSSIFTILLMLITISLIRKSES